VVPVVLLILALAWIVLLAPSGWKWFSGRRAGASIDSFHRELHLLEHTGPKLIAPAFRLHTAYSTSALAPSQSGFPAVSSMPDHPPLVLLRPNEQLDLPPSAQADPGRAVVTMMERGAQGGGGAHERGYGYGYGHELSHGFSHGDGDAHLDESAPAGRAASMVASGSATHRGPPSLGRPVSWPVQGASRGAPSWGVQRGRRRGRTVVAALGAILVVTGLAGLAPHLHALWVVTGLSGGALLGFVGLAAYALTIADRSRRDRVGDPRIATGPSATMRSGARRRPAHAAGPRRDGVGRQGRSRDDGFDEGVVGNGWVGNGWAGDEGGREDEVRAGGQTVGGPQRYREGQRAAGATR
jgi:hypothetical protein